jgi:hypothetical protein
MIMEIVLVLLALTAIVTIARLSRARATRRFDAALALYAEREIRRYEARRSSSISPPGTLGAARVSWDALK